MSGSQLRITVSIGSGKTEQFSHATSGVCYDASNVIGDVIAVFDRLLQRVSEEPRSARSRLPCPGGGFGQLGDELSAVMSEYRTGLGVTDGSSKRRLTGSPLVSGPQSKTRAPNTRQTVGRAPNASRRSSANRTAHASRTTDAIRMSRSRGGCDTAPATETINVVDNRNEDVEDVVDLTCEGSDASAVVDLTNNDSVLLVDEGPGSRRQTSAVSYILSSDDEEDNTSRQHTSSGALAVAGSRWTPGTVSCPVCMDSYSEMVGSGRLVVSTKCGHVFCSQCLKDSLKVSHTCPTCRKKLTPRQYHPLYI